MRIFPILGKNIVLRRYYREVKEGNIVSQRYYREIKEGVRLFSI
jgi:hypothetical protein